jgi:hypothetical protein
VQQSTILRRKIMTNWTARWRTAGARCGVFAGVAAAALVAAGWPLAPAHASGAASPRVAAVFTHFVDDGSAVPSQLPCPGGQALRGDATFGVRAGDTWHGTSVYDFCLVPASAPNSFTFSGIETFTGTVAGCGAGTITYTVADGFAQLAPDPAAPNGHQRWTIVPGAGTGGLAGVIGGLGVGIFTIQPTLANNGVFAGVVTC